MVEPVQPIALYNPATPEAPEPLSLAPLLAETPDAKVLNQRADKYDFALGAESPGKDAIVSMLSTGARDHLSSALASRKDAEDVNHRVAIVQAISKIRQGPVSQEEMDVIHGLKPDPKGRDLNTILEQEYARQFMNYVTTSTYLATTLQDLSAKDGDAPFRQTDIAQGVKAKQEVILRVNQDYEEKYKKYGWAGAIGNHLLNIVPLYGTWSTQRMLPKLEGSLWPGTGLAQKLQSMHLMGTEEFEKTFVAEAARLWAVNPPEAMRFIRSVNQYTSSDAGIANAFAVMDIAGVAGMFPGKAASATVSVAHDAAIAAGRGLTRAELEASVRVSNSVLGDISRTVGPDAARNMNAAELAKADLFVAKGPAEYSPEAIKKMADGLDSPAFKSAQTFLDNPGIIDIHQIAKTGRMPNGAVIPKEDIATVIKKLELAQTYREILKASSGPETDLAKIIGAAGDTSTSSVLQASKEAAQILQGKDGVANLGERVQSLLNPTRLDNATALTAEATKRVSLGLAQNTKVLMEAALDPVRVRRLPDLALIAGMKETEQKIVSQYRRISDGIMDMEWNVGRAPEDVKNFPAGKKLNVGNRENVNSVDVLLGKLDASPFNSAENAEFTAKNVYKLGDGVYKIEHQSGGYVLRVSKPLDETSAGVRDLLIQTETQTPQSMWNIFVGKLRSSQDTTSLLSSASRSLVTHGGQAMQSMMKEIAGNIGELSKDELKNMRRFFDLDRRWQGVDKTPGRFLETAGEFETEYHHAFKRLPTEKETLAYFSYRQLNDFDWLTRNLGLYRDLNRLGVEQIRFRFVDAEGNKVLSPYFMARERKELPLGPNRPGAGVYIFDSTTGTGRTLRTSKMTEEATADVTKKLKQEGYKIYEVANPIERPLREATGYSDYINFVMVRDADTKALDYNLIPYKAGGHIEYSTNWFGKQAAVTKLGGRANYEGDITLIGQHTEAETRKYVDALNKAREMLKGKDPGFDAFVARNLPAEWGSKELRQKFASGTWNIDEPFHVVATGQSVRDVDAAGLAARYGDKLHDEANSPYNLFQQVDKKFTGSRDPLLRTIKERGSEQQPLYSLESAPMIDVLDSLNRTVSNVVHQHLISDFKYQGAETFVQEFGRFLDVPIETLRQNPVYWLNNAEGHWIKTPDAVGLATAKAQQQAVLSFLGMDAPDVRAVKWLQQKALDTIFKKQGQWLSDWTAENAIPRISDPFKYVRAMVFHEKLGLFNPVSIINQLQTLTHVTALAGPVVAAKAMAGATMMSMLRLTENPAILAKYDGIATSFGWKPGQLTQAYNEMKKSGWHLVQGETSWKADVSDPKMFQHAWGKFLDAGSVFFTEGERFTRTAAWAASYLENSVKTPVKAWNAQSLQAVLARADLMNVNMTRASQASWQGGIPGVITQFMPYQVRLFEQLWGGRLTSLEKARVLATYGAMYGVPATSGVAVGFWPMYDSIRTHALETNVYGDGKAWDNSMTKAIMEGLPSIMIGLATGKDTNYSERFSPPGLSGIHDLMTGDKAWWEILTGVAGSNAKDLGKALSPITASVAMAVMGRSQEHPFVVDDVITAFRPITTVNNTYKAIYAWNWGKYVTKNEGIIANADKMDALNTGAFGLTRRDISDSFRLIKSNKTLDAAQRALAPDLIKEIRHAYQAAGNNDDETAAMHITRAQHLFAGGDFKPDQWRDIMKQATAGYENLTDRVRFDFFFKKAPASQQQQRMKALGVNPDDTKGTK